MTDKNQYKEGDSVFNDKHGDGRIYMITNDKDYSVIVKFHNYTIVNYYYNQEGVGINSDCGNIEKV